ncbi:hypothetical protein PIB30_055152 [Stylosanthes scabra]|uniref:Uncharacterized protein n=1 Tax=Stylosanthes scabra TaxID=79078 RepID=A0ABU6RJ42_9FABA|nr:hypothetical protein [Stylosanthes scabra]
MEQIGNVDGYFSVYLPYAKKLGWNDSAILKNFLLGLETYIHKDIIFDDPQNLWDAYCLAKFYEEKWRNPFSEMSKPQLSSQIKIQKNSSEKFSEISSATSTDALAIPAQQSKQLQSRIENLESSNPENKSNLPALVSSIHQLQRFLPDAATAIDDWNASCNDYGAEDDTVAKGNVDSTEVDVGSADLTNGSSDVVGAFAEGMWTAPSRTTVAKVADGDIRARRLRRFVSLTPPPLLAAVLPWNRDDKKRLEGDRDRRAVLIPSCELARRGGSHIDSFAATIGGLAATAGGWPVGATRNKARHTEGILEGKELLSTVIDAGTAGRGGNHSALWTVDGWASVFDRATAALAMTQRGVGVGGGSSRGVPFLFRNKIGKEKLNPDLELGLKIC